MGWSSLPLLTHLGSRCLRFKLLNHEVQKLYCNSLSGLDVNKHDMTENIILDCDPGRDDAFAIALALASPEEINLLGVTAVAGNIAVSLAQRNARLILEICGHPEIPVYTGAKNPLKREPVGAENHHGDGGLEGIDVYEPAASVQSTDAIDYILDSLSEADAGSITIVATGPLTNLAIAYARAPEIFTRARQIVIMGGAQREGGNITPSAEFNIFADPHAAASIMHCDCPLVMFGLDVTHQVLAGRPEADYMRRHGGDAAKTLSNLVLPVSEKQINAGSATLHDPCTIAWLIQPDLFQTKSVNIEVECDSPLTQGMTIVDMRGRSGRLANVLWAHDVNGPATVDLIVNRIITL